MVGIDLLELQPIRGVHLIRGDFDSQDGLQAIEAVLEGRKANLVLSDMAPEMSGNKLVDQARMMHLNDMTLNFAINHLRQGGHLLLKTFMGDGFDTFRKELAGWFSKVKIIKPAASRKSSAEMFLLADGFHG